ncbi:MAG TPA: Maf family protein [Woeseiaceae bacterium]|nr:Maf family protein [Woeseiaceae bacterium]
MPDPSSTTETLGSPLVLASASPRRRAILDALGVRYSVQPADIDERHLPGENASDMVLRLACDKAMMVAGRYAPHYCVLGADTAVVLDDQVFGKPGNESDGLAMLRELSGREHRVLTGVVVVTRGASSGVVVETRVSFRKISPDEARRYWQTGEPRGKAGAYAIQGLGGLFVASISGSYTGVVGLPIFETGTLLREAGLDLLAASAAGRP